ncbi:hypothetical protein CH333_00930 [candidate division WOR-3 bacterium JGI_Cruoil_03_44_89]|uniref:Methyltransferase domain-containing protein n=1 Tax=candidate division WOR-3 bacterium JGI_Cruoil_03_44_89 TaxID=1973748 RepID=A0A235BYL4_UNCW3|nr:MAG: hypothetical protein CH333_00930 [candidate division WOR-3 bacterium JGI_Cruoil_03_44_89]
MGEIFERIANFYDLTNAWLTGDIPFYIEYAKKTRGPALELGCGTGRVLIPIAEAGIEIWGLDISKPMLEIAKRKAEKLTPPIRKNIKLIRGDMKEFELKKKFSYIFIAFRSFQSLLTKEDQNSCLGCVSSHLDKDGIFILDLFVPKHDLLAKERLSMYPEKNYNKKGNIVITQRAEVEYDLVSQNLKENKFYEWTDENGHFHREIWTFELSYLFRYEVELLLKKHGFEIGNVFGTFDKKPYNYYSGEQIFVARKR